MNLLKSSHLLPVNMKTSAILALLAGSASAFAPMSSSKATTSLNVSPDLEGMVGPSVETGNKIVSSFLSIAFSQSRQ